MFHTAASTPAWRNCYTNGWLKLSARKQVIGTCSECNAPAYLQQGSATVQFTCTCTSKTLTIPQKQAE